MISKVYFDELSEDEKNSHESEFYAYKKNLFKIFGNSLELKKGINVLFGDNGCGKSTLLRMIARETFSYEGYNTEDYSGWTRWSPENADMFSAGIFSEKEKNTDFLRREEYYMLPEGRIRLDWNGAFTFYRDCTKFNQVMKSPFGSILPEKISALLPSISKGMSTLTTGVEIREAILNPSSFDNYSFHIFDIYGEKEITEGPRYEFAKKNFEFWKDYLKSLGDESTPTLLLDEPDAHLSIDSQVAMWDMLISETKDREVQLIVASHNVIPLFYKKANVISFEKDYAERIKNNFKSLIEHGDFS